MSVGNCVAPDVGFTSVNGEAEGAGAFPVGGNEGEMMGSGGWCETDNGGFVGSGVGFVGFDGSVTVSSEGMVWSVGGWASSL